MEGRMGGWVYPSSTCFRWQVRSPRSSRWPATSVPERRLIAPHSLGAPERSSCRRGVDRQGRDGCTGPAAVALRGEGEVDLRVGMAQLRGGPAYNGWTRAAVQGPTSTRALGCVEAVGGEWPHDVLVRDLGRTMWIRRCTGGGGSMLAGAAEGCGCWDASDAVESD
jgi:hypothetical protein